MLHNIALHKQVPESNTRKYACTWHGCDEANCLGNRLEKDPTQVYALTARRPGLLPVGKPFIFPEPPPLTYRAAAGGSSVPLQQRVQEACDDLMGSDEHSSELEQEEMQTSSDEGSTYYSTQEEMEEQGEPPVTSSLLNGQGSRQVLGGIAARGNALPPPPLPSPAQLGVPLMRVVLVHHKNQEKDPEPIVLCLPFDMAVWLMFYLNEVWPRLNQDESFNLLFSRPDGTPMSRSDHLQQAWAAAQVKHDAPWEPFTPKQLRDAHAQFAIKSLGEALVRGGQQTIAGHGYIMGHDSVWGDTWQQVYAKPTCKSEMAQLAVDDMTVWRYELISKWQQARAAAEPATHT